MNIKTRLKGLDLFLRRICADRNASFPPSLPSGKIEMKREVKHSLNISQKRADRFNITVKDKVSFGPEVGPFNIEIVVEGVVFLKEVMKPREIRGMVKDKTNISFLINQCLPHTCATIAYLTDRMGFNPIILAPQFPLSREEG
ncbi:MAG: hypothetical protein HY878_05375 [Deltaproteobacteria bacterium]|nr:hypothetical protein [Deltaproteobacteria bacterium]